MDKRKFMEEAARLALEAVDQGFGGPFGAVIVKDGEIVGRGQNRVLKTGCPVYHAEITAIIDATTRLNAAHVPEKSPPVFREGHPPTPNYTLTLIPREPSSPDPVPRRARMLKG